MSEKIYLFNNKEIRLLKINLAKSLSKKIDQRNISKILNITQPMVSNYINSNEQIPKKINEFTKKIINKDIKKINFNSAITFSNPKRNEYFLANENELISDQKQKVINNLNEAFSMLKDKDIQKILPQVKINIAMSLEKIEDKNDIASFSNGFLIINDRIAMISEIVFGKSKHLSKLLLYLKKQNNEINSIMNIKYLKTNEIKNLESEFLTKDYKLKSEIKNKDILLHKGDFGIEPCAYIIGKDAKDIAKKY
ncbi:MAG: thiamine-phosphate synthase family protein [Minisyncoccales bacterium]